MNKYINIEYIRQAIEQAIRIHGKDYDNSQMKFDTDSTQISEAISDTNIQEEKYAQWVFSKYGTYECSACKFDTRLYYGNPSYIRSYKYCPSCGSKMEEKKCSFDDILK